MQSPVSQVAQKVAHKRAMQLLAYERVLSVLAMHARVFDRMAEGHLTPNDATCRALADEAIGALALLTTSHKAAVGNQALINGGHNEISSASKTA